MVKTSTILDLLEKGYIPFEGNVPSRFYTGKRCKCKKKAEWFLRPKQKMSEPSRGICLGCRKRCVVINPRAWPVVLEETESSRESTVQYVQVERVSVDELLRMKRVLRVEEAAWALNVSRQKVHRWVDEGILEQVAGNPLRVTTASVERVLQPYINGDSCHALNRVS